MNDYELFQQKWNFRESDYNDTPSNNGYVYGSPAFAFTTNLAKYIVIKKAAIRNGKIIKVWRASEKEPTLEEFKANPGKYYGSPDAMSD